MENTSKLTLNGCNWRILKISKYIFQFKQSQHLKGFFQYKTQHLKPKLDFGNPRILANIRTEAKYKKDDWEWECVWMSEGYKAEVLVTRTLRPTHVIDSSFDKKLGHLSSKSIIYS